MPPSKRAGRSRPCIRLVLLVEPNPVAAARWTRLRRRPPQRSLEYSPLYAETPEELAMLIDAADKDAQR